MQNIEVGGWGVIEDLSLILAMPGEFSSRTGFMIETLAWKCSFHNSFIIVAIAVL